MNFEEFLMALDEEYLLECIKECYEKNKQMTELIHQKALNLYRIYLITGGMPESVLSMVNAKCDYIKYDKNILEDIVKSYFNDMDKNILQKKQKH